MTPKRTSDPAPRLRDPAALDPAAIDRIRARTRAEAAEEIARLVARQRAAREGGEVRAHTDAMGTP